MCYMHILFLTDNFPPEVNAPASRTYEHAREWVKAGHSVTVITCAPNFPKGKLFDGYRNRLWQDEWIDGIHVVRVWTYIAANEGFLLRILDYVSFMITATLAAPFIRKPEIVVGTSPQFFTACAAYLVSRIKHIPFVFELRDLWPESIRAVGVMEDSFMIRFLERVEMFLYQKADAIVSVTNSFKQRLVERGIDGKKIHVVTNGVDISRFSPVERDKALIQLLELEGFFVCGYIGTHGLAHSLETILDTAEQFQVQGQNDIRFLFLGDGACKATLTANAQRRNLKNVRFIDSVSKTEVVRYWSLIDVSIIHLRKTELFASVIPSKLFECMGMGIPVLHGVAGESAEIVAKEKIGVVFEPENSRQLADKLLQLKEDPDAYDACRQNSLLAARRYDRSALALQMLDVILELANERSLC